MVIHVVALVATLSDVELLNKVRSKYDSGPKLH
jgi:hypothetical protein